MPRRQGPEGRDLGPPKPVAYLTGTTVRARRLEPPPLSGLGQPSQYHSEWSRLVSASAAEQVLREMAVRLMTPRITLCRGFGLQNGCSRGPCPTAREATPGSRAVG